MQMASTHDPRCDEIAHPNLPNFVLSLLILIGILVSYLPQHFRIIARRSSEGLSSYFILLGTVSGTCAIANILVHPTSRTDVSCCAVNSAFSCAAGLLGIAQVGVQWSCFFLITLLFLIFIPRPGTDHRQHGRHDHLVPTNNDSHLRDALIVVSISIVHFIVTFIICVVFLARFPQHLLIWANILGTTSAVLASIQYVPQIWTTWCNQHIGSLSIPMMCIQTPGSYVFAASLAIRLGAKGWSAWIVYVVTGSLQAILLCMAIVFERRDRKNAKDGRSGLHDDLSDDPDGITDHSDDETDPLIERDRLAERQRQQRLLDQPTPSALNHARPRPGPTSSSSDSPPDDLLIDRAALAARENQQRSALADMASSIAAPFRRQSTRYFDAISRRESQRNTDISQAQENNSLPRASGDAVGRARVTPSYRAANESQGNQVT